MTVRVKYHDCEITFDSTSDAPLVAALMGHLGINIKQLDELCLDVFKFATLPSDKEKGYSSRSNIIGQGSNGRTNNQPLSEALKLIIEELEKADKGLSGAILAERTKIPEGSVSYYMRNHKDLFIRARLTPTSKIRWHLLSKYRSINTEGECLNQSSSPNGSS